MVQDVLLTAGDLLHKSIEMFFCLGFHEPSMTLLMPFDCCSLPPCLEQSTTGRQESRSSLNLCPGCFWAETSTPPFPLAKVDSMSRPMNVRYGYLSIQRHGIRLYPP